MALIGVTFKNNDTTTEKTKTGKLNTRQARMLFSNYSTKKVGIFENYRKDEVTEPCTIASYETVGQKINIIFNKGAVSIYGGIGVIEQGTRFEIDKNTNYTNGSLGIKVDLNQPAGSEMSFYAKDGDTLQTDNLLIQETNGVYELELYKFTLINGTFTLGARNSTQIIETVDKKIDDINKYFGVDYIVEEKISEDKNIWYRKWASGFKECYVIETMPSGSSSQYYTNYEIDLPIEFSSTNYGAFANTINGTGVTGAVQDVNYLGALMNVIVGRSEKKISIMALHNRTVCVQCMGF